MRKLFLIATLLLATFALARTAGNTMSYAQDANDNMQGGMQGEAQANNTQPATNDWYQQHLSAAVQESERVWAASSPAAEAIAENATEPGSMAASQEAQGVDWYNQVLQREVAVYQRRKALVVPSSGGTF